MVPPTDELLLREHIFDTMLIDDPLLAEGEDGLRAVQADAKDVLLRSLRVWVEEYMPTHAYVRPDKRQAKLTDADRKRIAKVCRNDKSSSTEKVHTLVDLGVITSSAARKFSAAVEGLLPKPEPEPEPEPKARPTLASPPPARRRKGKRKAARAPSPDKRVKLSSPEVQSLL